MKSNGLLQDFEVISGCLLWFLGVFILFFSRFCGGFHEVVYAYAVLEACDKDTEA